MTGPLEWLSQEPLENRKADSLIALKAPIALRGIQMAERDIRRVAHRAGLADRRRAISARFAALRSASEQQIIAHVQGKIAAIDPTLSPAARRAAIDQLIAERVAALLHLKQDIRQQSRQARRAVGRALNTHFSKQRYPLMARHAVEREASCASFGDLHRRRVRARKTFPVIRRIIALFGRRSAWRQRSASPHI